MFALLKSPWTTVPPPSAFQGIPISPLCVTRAIAGAASRRRAASVGFSASAGSAGKLARSRAQFASIAARSPPRFSRVQYPPRGQNPAGTARESGRRRHHFAWKDANH